MEELRAELAERSPCEASSCPSWPRCVSWLQANGHAEIGEWLALALAGLRRAGDHERLLAVIERVLAAHVEVQPDVDQGGRPVVRRIAERLWRGELGWSLWFGPFVIAYIGPAFPTATELRAALGPLGMLLADDRVWIEDQGKRRFEIQRGVALQRGVPLLLVQTLPGAQEPICSYLQHERTGGRARTSRWDRTEGVGQLGGSIVVGPPEALPRQFDEGHRAPWFAPLPSFERRYQQLAAAQPSLIGRLRSELDSRPIAQAHTCPSWPVYLDWLLDRGDELFAEWLRLDLAAHTGDEQAAAAVAKFSESLDQSALALVRHRGVMTLSMLWPAGRRFVGDRTTWFGPFMISYFDPPLASSLGADELQAILGRHASFLPRARIFLELDQAWLEQASVARAVPTLAPTPPRATEQLAHLLADRAPQRRPAGRMRIAKPGTRIEARPQRTLATNVGRIAANHEAVALLCCETEVDVWRHAGLWNHLQTFEHVIVLGTPELLARWPHAGEWIEPWGAGLSS